MNYPALELVWTPTGLGSVVNRHAWPVGGLQELPPQGLSFGIEGDVRLRSPPEPKEICKIDRRGGGVRLWHLLKRYHCVVNGRLIDEQEVVLHHRDLVALPMGPVVRVLEEEMVRARSPSLEAAISAAPEDRELVHVYSDFLLDQGDPLGERLARSRGVSGAFADDAQWLDVLAGHYEAGALEVEWSYGLAVKAVLRSSLRAFSTLEQALAHLLALPVMRFLRDLTVDISSDKLSVAEALHALGRVQLPVTLARLGLGDLPEADRARTAALLAASRLPIDVSYYAEAQLVILSSAAAAAPKVGETLQVGDRLELGRSGFMSGLNQNVLLGGSHLVVRDGPRFVLARIQVDADPAKVNGRVVDRFPLREGDVVELPGELSARFKLVR
ncbi:MAG: hypothetical protein IPJ65_43625 [Archangiaceae bacterium]|nr:hypothetical protein [Archangiaceae bacterium]